ncbi:unnamed protein product [Effrenium voratum]|nr:unnamed protein product [Effrenium voratum]
MMMPLLLCTFLIVSMQLGFAMLEVGCVRQEHRMTVLARRPRKSACSKLQNYITRWVGGWGGGLAQRPGYLWAKRNLQDTFGPVQKSPSCFRGLSAVGQGVLLQGTFFLGVFYFGDVSFSHHDQDN